MGDTSRFYESVKNKYPKLKDGTRVHLWPKENIIIVLFMMKKMDIKKVSEMWIA
ncbi:TPA: hypothetical protein ACMVA9_001396 [Clostridioides difficile]